MDLFVVPTIGFKLLYGFLIVRIHRRDLVWFNVTANPTAEWVARQITEAFPWDGAARYMIRDRDRIYGTVVTRRLRAMGIRDKPIAPASPWQNGFSERLIGSIRRECLDHIIVFGEAHLRRILKSYADYYNSVRTHRSLHKDAPISRPIHQTGIICSQPILSGLHHHYVRVSVFGTHRSCQVPNSGRIVAIVDDDEAVGNAIEVLMRSIGLVAQAFSSGEEFLRSPELSRTGCLVVDFDMPKMSGLDLHNNLSRLGKEIPGSRSRKGK